MRLNSNRSAADSRWRLQGPRMSWHPTAAPPRRRAVSPIHRPDVTIRAFTPGIFGGRPNSSGFAPPEGSSPPEWVVDAPHGCPPWGGSFAPPAHAPSTRALLPEPVSSLPLLHSGIGALRVTRDTRTPWGRAAPRRGRRPHRRRVGLHQHGRPPSGLAARTPTAKEKTTGPWWTPGTAGVSSSVLNPPSPG
jgi:hypothetical protein